MGNLSAIIPLIACKGDSGTYVCPTRSILRDAVRLNREKAR